MPARFALRSWAKRLPILVTHLTLFGLGCLPGCSPTPPAPAPDAEGVADGPEWFEDVTDRAGIDFVHDAGPPDVRFAPQIMGSGCAFLDFDGDGLLDVYLLQFAGPGSSSVNRLYRQLPDHRFRDVTAESGLGLAGHCHGVAVGDVNNDGRPDVLVSRYGGLSLFLNRGGKFEDVTAGSGLANPGWGTSAAFVDYDRDGWLDLVVVNYLDHQPGVECSGPDGTKDYCGPSNLAPVTSRLFRNLGPTTGGVRFEDVSVVSGVGRVPGPGLGVACADFDGDGWPDILIANDGQPNRLWINRRDGTFADEALSRGLGYTVTGHSYAGMGVALGDTANTGLFDVYITHMNSQTHTLWRQSPRGLFRDRTAETGLAGTRWRGTGFGTVMADFDNDGALDIAVANGRVFHNSPAGDAATGPFARYADRNQLFVNDGAGRFRDVSPSNPALCGVWNVGRGLAVGDYDNDGAADLLVTALGGRARLLRNIAPGRGHWLAVRATDPKLNRDAYGAEVRVRAGGRDRLRLINPGESYLSSHSPEALFGLGASADFQEVVVTWPDGTRESFPGGRVDRRIVVRKGEGRHD
jgi:hypothetical protein